ncbi:FecR family protein [Sphingobacterium sp. Mn56C]|uniref:FecR family protein n=1 Tax=Sphingobacterium sp. Mn56C TaxID=3395261 RepID=UPI003BEB8588
MEIRELFIKYLNNTCTAQEEEQVNELLNQPEMLALLYRLMEEIDRNVEETNDALDTDSKMLGWQKEISSRIGQSVLDEFDKNNSPKKLWNQNIMRYAAAVIGLIFLASGAWFLIKSKIAPSTQDFAQKNEQVLPGVDQATLTLANGKVVSLSEASNGEIAEQSGVQIEKTADGNVVYSVKEDAIATSAYNTIATPRGGQYQVVLPDGSKAWLNAASSLSFPVQFQPNERRVKMTGEVYFEVAKLANKERTGRVPFFVETDKQTIQVLGTQFNVNAYTDEPFTRTTLVEGSVRIHAANSSNSILLKPGQQAVLKDQFTVNTIAVQGVISWKNGDFVFQGESLANILRQVSRWYDVDIDCPEELGKLRFNGMVSRSKPLSSLINIIQSTQKVNIELQGRRLIVTE